MISWVQAALLGLMSCCVASTTVCSGTTVGNYTSDRPLITSVFVGLTLSNVRGCIQIAVPTQTVYIALVTPGGTVTTDLRAVSYIGIPLAWALAKSQGLDLDGPEASDLADALSVMVGTVGTVQFYGTMMMNLVWQYIGWTRLGKKNLSIVGRIEVIFPLISHLLISFIPIMLIVYYGVDAIDQFKEALSMGSWHMKSLFALGSLLPTVETAILLKFVVNKATDLIFFLFDSTLAGFMHLTLIAVAAVGVVSALINYQITVIRDRAAASSAGIDDDEGDVQL